MKEPDPVEAFGRLLADRSPPDRAIARLRYRCREEEARAP